ncbi:MAG: hypothetical protein OHK0032_06280 [Thermodesulfovibrionales bacterium]
MGEKLIADIYIFSGLDSSEMSIVKGMLQDREYGAGEIIYREGDVGDSLNIIIRGKVRINKMTVEGDQFSITTLGEGGMFGILSFLDGSRHDATIVSEQPTRLMLLRKSDFDSLQQSNPLIASKILWRLSIHLASIVRNMNSQYMDLMHLMFRKSK